MSNQHHSVSGSRKTSWQWNKQKNKTYKSFHAFVAQSRKWILYELNMTLCGNIDLSCINKLSLLNNEWNCFSNSESESSCGRHVAILLSQFSAKAEKATFDGSQVRLWAVWREGKEIRKSARAGFSDGQLDQLFWVFLRQLWWNRQGFFLAY